VLETCRVSAYIDRNKVLSQAASIVILINYTRMHGFRNIKSVVSFVEPYILLEKESQNQAGYDILQELLLN
jgi:hypothetical protein